MISIEEAQQLLTQGDISRDQAFEIIKTCGSMVMQHGNKNDSVVDCVIRMIEKRAHLCTLDPSYAQMISALCREVGLFPYLNKADSTWDDGFAAELFRDPTNSETVFHLEQALIFNELAAGKGIALSAPTSFGKSLLIDSTIRARKPHTVVVVVPTLSLLDETRRRITKSFSSQYQIITLNSQERINLNPAIYIGTQERLFERPDLRDIDFLVIDEFYKLNFGKHDRERSITLNLLLNKLSPLSKQIYLLGPPVDKLEIEGHLRRRIRHYPSTFAPVATEVHDLRHEANSFEALVRVLQKYPNDPTLIFCGSPSRARSLAISLAPHLKFRMSGDLDDLSNWLATQYHPDWHVVNSIKHGIGIHHGRVPRSVSQMFVRMFNRGIITTLICTSSLIEGVNTVAKNICIYDKTIDGSRNLSFFEYQNIRGRAGRMFKHYVGRIFLFHNPPDRRDFSPLIPAFRSPELAPEEILLQLPPRDFSDAVRTRREEIVKDTILSRPLIEKWSRHGIDNLERLTVAVANRIGTGDAELLWTRYGKFKEIEATFKFLWDNFRFEKHNTSPRLLAHFINCYRKQNNIRRTLDYLILQSDGRFDSDQTIESFFCVMRGCEFTFPNVLMLLQDIILYIGGEKVSGLIDYGLFARDIQNWYLPGALRGLDEYGVPIPIIQAFQYQISNYDVDLAIEQLKAMVFDGEIQGTEARIVRGALDIPIGEPRLLS